MAGQGEWGCPFHEPGALACGWMTCPLLRRAHGARCRAVAGPAAPVDPAVLRSYCHADYLLCPAYRFLRATGRSVHPADFEAWVIRGISPGRLDPDPAGLEPPG